MSGRKILVVDDDADIRGITSLALEVIGGWDVVAVESGIAALESLGRRRADVVLLDVMMPVMDGPTTFSRMQADPSLRDIPVVLLTAKVQVGNVQVWDSMPVAGVIAKPFNPTTLSAEVDALVEAHLASARPGLGNGLSAG